MTIEDIAATFSGIDRDHHFWLGLDNRGEVWAAHHLLGLRIGGAKRKGRWQDADEAIDEMVEL